MKSDTENKKTQKISSASKPEQNLPPLKQNGRNPKKSTGQSYEQKGYLHQNFRLFHLCDKKEEEFNYHYHDFNKIIIFLSGNVTYLIEGKAYFLKPWDILLVHHHDIHKPVIDPSKEYERIILWMKNDYQPEPSAAPENLYECFQRASDRSFNLIRSPASLQEKLKQLIAELELSLKSREFGSEILSNALFLQFMVYINRIFLKSSCIAEESFLKYNPAIEQVLKYINTNLGSDLSVDVLASRFFLSRYYLMHKFKTETGYTVHQYVTSKRLIQANHLMSIGVPAGKAAALSGFSDYSVFSRAYKKMFHQSPRSAFPSSKKDKNPYYS